MTNQTWCHTPASAGSFSLCEIDLKNAQTVPTAKYGSTQLPKTPILDYLQPMRRRNKYGATHLLWQKIDKARDEYNVSSLCVNPHPKPARTRPKVKYRRMQPSKTAAPKHLQCTQQVRYGATPAPAGLWYTIGSPFTAQNLSERNQMPKCQKSSRSFSFGATSSPLHYTKAMKLKAKYGHTQPPKARFDVLVPKRLQQTQRWIIWYHTPTAAGVVIPGVLSMHETPLDKNTAEIQDETQMCAATCNPIRTPLSKPVRTPPNNPTAMHAMALMPRRSPLHEDMPNEDSATRLLRQGPPLHDTPPKEYTDKVQGEIREHAADQTPPPKYQQAI
ncbi:hypothetical protein BS47DRAFT_1363253 [Hydnum rufescens UP504]|uniref:Uncharacterized protein n=1 Tax=Hydnum rufescens UP504 TaxID=1448309 RepID=A0A9P6AV06_9AGAM|nr:hypothetical protein BS47DRAFT_1363253 [Hydnum rufescens UP504]